MNQLLIFPYNGNGLESVDCLNNDWELIGFIDDRPDKQGKQSNGYQVFSRDALKRYPQAKVLAVPGSPTSYLSRSENIGGLNLSAERFATIIHPKANISRSTKLGCNVLIMAGVVATYHVTVGNHVCILPNTVLHHDSEIGDWTLIGANVTVAGGVKIGQNCYVGSASSMIHNIEIGEKTLIGIGANVIRSVPPNSKMVGNPARPIP